MLKLDTMQKQEAEEEWHFLSLTQKIHEAHWSILLRLVVLDLATILGLHIRTVFDEGLQLFHHPHTGASAVWGRPSGGVRIVAASVHVPQADSNLLKGRQALKCAVQVRRVHGHALAAERVLGLGAQQRRHHRGRSEPVPHHHQPTTTCSDRLPVSPASWEASSPAYAVPQGAPTLRPPQRVHHRAFADAIKLGWAGSWPPCLHPLHGWAPSAVGRLAGEVASLLDVQAAGGLLFLNDLQLLMHGSVVWVDDCLLVQVEDMVLSHCCHRPTARPAFGRGWSVLDGEPRGAAGRGPGIHNCLKQENQASAIVLNIKLVHLYSSYPLNHDTCSSLAYPECIQLDSSYPLKYSTCSSISHPEHVHLYSNYLLKYDTCSSISHPEHVHLYSNCLLKYDTCSSISHPEHVHLYSNYLLKYDTCSSPIL